MKAAVLHELGRPMSVEEIVVGELLPHEVRVRTAAAGLCHSDLHHATGAWPVPVPIVLGHEGAGVVEAIGSAVTRFSVGDHVIVYNHPGCGHCRQCLRGRPAICTNRPTDRPPGAPPALSLDGRPVGRLSGLGTFAEQMIVTEPALVGVPRDVPLEAAALISCGVITGFGAAVHAAAVRVGDTVAVIGVGGVGLNAVQGAVLAGAARVFAVDRNPRNLELARALGATDAVDAARHDPVEAVRQAVGGVDHAIEAIGLESTVEQAWQMLDSGGTVTVIGLLPRGARVSLPASDFVLEKRIQGSLMGSSHYQLLIPVLIELYRDGRLELDSMITELVAIDHINDAYERMAEVGATGRAVVVFDREAR